MPAVSDVVRAGELVACEIEWQPTRKLLWGKQAGRFQARVLGPQGGEILERSTEIKTLNCCADDPACWAAVETLTTRLMQSGWELTTRGYETGGRNWFQHAFRRVAHVH